mmetsp:Transcript_816/g.1266  ORF Transcript_816/g.1266 Transcript_816/m.1266 type:complete len:274 (+) Transcript_816:1709-2530(+)
MNQTVSLLPGEASFDKACGIFSTKGGFNKLIRTVQYALKLASHYQAEQKGAVEAKNKRILNDFVETEEERKTHKNKSAKLISDIESSIERAEVSKQRRRVLRQMAGFDRFISKADTLAGVISEARYVNRLFELIETFQGLLWARKHTDPIDMLLDIIKGLSMVAYYPLEYAYWAKGYKLTDAPWIDVDEFSRWSCQAWAIYILADMIHDIYRLTRKRSAAETRVYLMRWITNLCDMVLAIHWSIKNSTLLNKGQVGLYGTIGSVAGIIGLFSK